MIKIVLIGLWVCGVSLASSYVAAQWKAEAPAVEEEPYFEGLEYRKLQPITVPMIADGTVKGYVLARLVFTADARALREFPLEPEPFVLDEAFREIYLNGKVDFGQMQKHDLDSLTQAIKAKSNERLGPDFVHDILVEEINYVDRTALMAQDTALQGN
jgi:hypothetical protein